MAALPAPMWRMGGRPPPAAEREPAYQTPDEERPDDDPEEPSQDPPETWSKSPKSPVHDNPRFRSSLIAPRRSGSYPGGCYSRNGRCRTGRGDVRATGTQDQRHHYTANAQDAKQFFRHCSCSFLYFISFNLRSSMLRCSTFGSHLLETPIASVICYLRVYCVGAVGTSAKQRIRNA